MQPSIPTEFGSAVSEPVQTPSPPSLDDAPGDPDHPSTAERSSVCEPGETGLTPPPAVPLRELLD